MTTPSLLRPPEPQRARDASWVADTLGRLVADVRTLLPLDGCAFLAVHEDGLRPVVESFDSPELRAALASPGGLAELAIAQERPLLLPRVDDWEAAPRLREPAERWRTLRGGSVIAVPIKRVTGKPLGVLVVASLEGGTLLGRDELRTVEVLTDLAVLALERDELLDREGRRSRDDLMLKRAAEDISGSLELDEVYARIIRHALAATGGAKAAITRVNARAAELEVVASVGFSRGFTRRRHDFSAGMIGAVARSRAPYLTRAGDAAQWDREAMESEQVGSFMHVPIELGPRLFGILTVADKEAEHFGEAELDRLANLARSSAAAIANAIDFGRERRIARALAVGFVPEPLPDVRGYESGVLYAPAANEPTGGDIYGAWELPGGQVAVLVGDVAGKGVETAALSSMVRFFIEARSWSSTCPAEVLTETNVMLERRIPSDTFVTVFLALLSPGGVFYANAGHLPPLVVRVDSIESLAPLDLPLGVDPEVGYQGAELELRDGDLLFAYTDGLIEARRDTETFGFDRLEEFVRRMGPVLSPDELVQAVYREVAGWAGGLSDDAAALALRRRSD